MELVLTITPAFRGSIVRTTAWVRKYIARMLTAKTVSNCSVGHLLEGHVHRDAGVVDQDVDAAEEIDRLGGQLGGGVGLAEVGLDGRDLRRAVASGLLDGGHRAVAAAGVVKDDVGALAAELQGHLAADARAGARDQDSLAFHALTGCHRTPQECWGDLS